MSLPSWVTTELILGIVGSATGVSALLLNLMRYLKEKPKIEAEIIEATHRYLPNGKTIVLNVDVRIKNKGDQATTIGEAKAEVTIGKQLHVLPQEPTMIPSASFVIPPPEDEDLAVRVEPHDLVITTLSFSHESSMSDFPRQEKIPFELFLPHAHGEIKGLRGISRLKELTS